MNQNFGQILKTAQKHTWDLLGIFLITLMVSMAIGSNLPAFITPSHQIQPSSAPILGATDEAVVNDVTIESPLAQSSTPSASFSPSPENQIDCTGPDGKVFKTTAQACSDFNQAWGVSPSLTPEPTGTTENPEVSSETPDTSPRPCFIDEDGILTLTSRCPHGRIE